MQRLSRDSWLAIGLVVALVVILCITYALQNAAQLPPLASFSNQPDGGRALRLWLERLGYRVDDAVRAEFTIPDATQLVLILEPTEPITPLEWRVLDDWVEGGGTLILAGDRYAFPSWAERFEFDRQDWITRSPTATLYLQQPLLRSPPIASHPTGLPTAGILTTGRTDVLVHAAVAEGPVVVSFAQGAGRIVLSASALLFSNSELHNAEGAGLVLNLVSLAGEPGTVWFDEWHHGIRTQTAAAAGIGDWLRVTTAGRAILLAMAIIFVALLLQGRNFGRPVPLPQGSTRRTALEYVSAIAQLHRRAGHRTAVLLDYRQRLKRELGRRYRLDPGLGNDDFVAQLVLLQPTYDGETLRQLLHRLSQPAASEHEMVAASAEAAHWLQ